MILDICLAYQLANRTQSLLKDKIPAEGLKLAELKTLIMESGKVPPGIPGLARATMTLTVIMILGVAVLHVLVIGVPGDDSQIANNILSMLAGLLAAMTGFYFGGKKKEEGGKGEEETTESGDRNGGS